MDKQVNEFLKQLLTNTVTYILTKEEEKLVMRSKVEFITNKLFRKKFRRRKLSDKTRKAIYNKVENSIKLNKPIYFVIPFGGYKHFWNPSHPEPDWAELFNMRYLTEYVLPVLTVYQPGVVIEYMSEDLIINRMNNYPPKSLDRYAEIFTQLINFYNSVTPNNLKYRYFRVGARCDKQKLVKEVESFIPKRRKDFGKLTQKQQEQELHRSIRSIYWNGALNLTKLSGQEKRERLIESRIIELAYYETESNPKYLGGYLWEDDHICICFSFGTTSDNDEFQDLTLASTKGCIVDYWIGRGVLRKRSDRFIPIIVSKTQYEEIKNKIKKVKVDSLLLFKNYKEIEVIIE